MDIIHQLPTNMLQSLKNSTGNPGFAEPLKGLPRVLVYCGSLNFIVLSRRLAGPSHHNRQRHKVLWGQQSAGRRTGSPEMPESHLMAVRASLLPLNNLMLRWKITWPSRLNGQLWNRACVHQIKAHALAGLLATPLYAPGELLINGVHMAHWHTEKAEANE